MNDEATPHEELEELSIKAGQRPPLVSEIVRVTIYDGEVYVTVGSFNVFFAKALVELRLEGASRPKEYRP